MRILRTMVAAALLAAPVVAYTLPTAAFAAVEDSTKNDTQILKDAQKKLKNKRFSGIQVSVQSGIVDAERNRQRSTPTSRMQRRTSAK